MGGKSKLSTYQEQVSHTQRVGRTRPGEKFYVGGRGGHAPHLLYMKLSFIFLNNTQQNLSHGALISGPRCSQSSLINE